MSGLYQCPNCHKFFMNSDEFDNTMDSVLAIQGKEVFSAVVICNCGHKTVHGANKSYNENGDIEYWSFGGEYVATEHKYLAQFPAIELIEVDNEKDSIASTFHNNKVIFLGIK